MSVYYLISYADRRRMHRLEQEQADLEYEIRLLMAQPERNKTDSDKEKEEALITRLVEVCMLVEKNRCCSIECNCDCNHHFQIVQLRNEVVECLEMDRIREAEEDLVSYFVCVRTGTHEIFILFSCFCTILVD